MNIQSAVRACQKANGKGLNVFARPKSWKNQGRAVDLARVLRTDTVKCVAVINENGAVCGSEWNPLPEDILDDWELIDAKRLYKEAQHEPEAEAEEVGGDTSLDDYDPPQGADAGC